MSARERGKQERRERILDAAEALVREAGEAAFSMRDLAARSGLSLATPFNLFGSKGAVLGALVERSLDAQQAILDATPEDDPIERVLALAERAVRAYTDDPSLHRPLLRALVGAVGESPPPPLLEACTALWRSSLRDAEAEALLDPATDVDLLARQLHLAYRAGLTLWVSGETDDRGWRLHVLHGVSLLLMGVVTGSAHERLRARWMDLQLELVSHSPRTEARRRAP